MKKLSAFWARIPRPLRTILHIVAILLCVVIYYGAIGAPSLTTEMQYRRVEQSHMIGPGTILGTEAISGNGQQQLLIAKSDTHVMLYRYTEESKTTSYDLVYRKNHGDLMILAAGGRLPTYSVSEDFSLPVILFDNYPTAVRAEVEFTMSTPDDEYAYPHTTQHYQKHFFLESNRNNEGYFYFEIQHKAYTSRLYTKMLNAIVNISLGVNYSSAKDAIVPISVRLYDQNDQLILDQIIYFRTVTADGFRP
ncbi:MAG: hypothetical protein J6A88_02915 [Oscillospiraceae bacterium]|nr:hypothetical protein [Oscillospiraceae bacterium]